MAQRVRIKASEGHRGFGKLLKRVYGSDEHLIIERAGDPVAVMMSYQEYGPTINNRVMRDHFMRARLRTRFAQSVINDELFTLSDRKVSQRRETFLR